MQHEMQEHPIYRVLRLRRMSIIDLGDEIDENFRTLYTYTAYRQQPSLKIAIKILVWGKGEIQPEELLKDIDDEEEIIDLKRKMLGQSTAKMSFIRKKED